MIKQNIFIINFKPLYEILEEIKENLPFSFINFKNEEAFVKDSNLDKINSLKNVDEIIINTDVPHILIENGILKKGQIEKNQSSKRLRWSAQLSRTQAIKGPFLPPRPTSAPYLLPFDLLGFLYFVFVFVLLLHLFF